ncbi:LysM peptidoglycan-binding domain-containing protein [Bacillus sp. FJAT-27245]|uniref:LysM peptidoglycan-binding domain-containing protein n=1 Tax=Bacillus sp. FJAT-27245 TaxID=1684144 RepID=UPI0006A7CB7D|nr:LysM peptidoglycan-binding domain-containing protein [Bacillus sp. FJAT-27245]
MKKMIIAVFFAALLVSMYVDLTAGTLPVSIAAPPLKSAEPATLEMPNFTAAVEPGQTLLSIVEQKRGKSPNVSIAKLIADFQLLNPGVSPERLQIGKEYRFPDYGR